MSKVIVAIGCLLLLALVVEQASAGRDFYKILGLSKTATQQQIKKAYRKLAQQYHPDKNPGDEEAAQKFQDIAAAYEALSDDEKRKTYDAHGEEGLKNGAQAHNPNDIFASMFGGFGMHFGQQERSNERPRGADVSFELDVTLEHLYNGHLIEVLRAKPVAETIPGKRQCNCRMEMRTHQVGFGSFQMVQQQVCDECENKKLVTHYRELQVDIEQGMVDGQEILFHGEGEPHLDGDNGDLKVRIKTLKHSRFRRSGDDLYTNVTITLRDALVGFDMKIKHLDDREIPLSSRQVLSHGSIMKIKGEGMRNYHNNLQTGDLYVTFDIEFPASISAGSVDDLVSILGQQSKQRTYNGLDKLN